MSGDNHVSNRRHVVQVASVVTLAVAMLAASAFILFSQPTATIPSVALPDMHPAITELLDRQRARVEANPDSADAWGVYGMCLQQHERLSEALTCFETAARLQPTSARWPYYAGVILEQTDSQNATSHFETVMRLSPEYTPAALRAAALRIDAGDNNEAARMLDDVDSRVAASAGSLLLRMRLARQTRNLDQLDALLRQARTLSINSRELTVEAAKIEMLRGNIDVARQLLQESKQLPPIASLDDDPWMNDVRGFDATGAVISMQADYLRQNGQLQEAANLFARLARRFPDRSRPGLNHAMMLAESGNLALAIQELNELSTRFPDDPLIHFDLAFVEFQAGHLDRAEQSTLTAIRLKSDFGAAWAALADICVATNRPEQALTAFRNAVAAIPEQADVQLTFAEFLIRNDRLKEAQSVLGNASLLVEEDSPLGVRWAQLTDRLHLAHETSK
jgi:predicted Zn-dependent protease